MTENEISNIVIGQALDIHRQLGPGLLESVYEHCLTHRLAKAGLQVDRQLPIPILFDEIKLECGFRCDILVEEKLLIEVKAVEELHPLHHAQVLTYLRLSGKKLGLLMNFNCVLMKDGIRRVVNGL